MDQNPIFTLKQEEQFSLRIASDPKKLISLLKINNKIERFSYDKKIFKKMALDII